MTDCIFCKIAKSDIPSRIIFENEKYLAFLDRNPLNPGHVLLIPKDHYRWVYDVPNVGEYWNLATEIGKKLITSLSASYISFITAGMEVTHAHIHIIPRYPNDHMSGMFDNYRLNSSQEEISAIAAKINSNINK